MERREWTGFTKWMADLDAAGAVTVTASGTTNTAEAIAG